jgi:IclR family transcriptional regulator, KDG regulon repressor
VDRISRTLEIMGCIAESEKSVGVTEISNKLKIHKSTVSRILSILQEQDWVVQLEDDTFTFGHKPLEFGLSVLSRVDIRKISKRYLDDLARATNETACLSIPVRHEQIVLDTIVSNQIIRAAPEIGSKIPLWIGATGKTILAFLDQHELDDILAIPAVSSDIDKLEKTLAEIRKQGFAISRGEHVSLYVCVAAPIFDHNEKVVGTISVAGPIPRFDENAARSFGPLVKETSKNISISLGSKRIVQEIIQ